MMTTSKAMDGSMSLPCVFIHTNPKQLLGAEVARYSLKRNSRTPDRFDVRIVSTNEFPFLQDYEGREYLREGRPTVWSNADLQSFTPLRFATPALMNFQGRAVVTDPDVFAVGDICALLDRDMSGSAILARQMAADSRRPLHYASSVMLLDCAKLRHWDLEKDFGRLFAFEHDYRNWMWLLEEPADSVKPLEPVWNDFDHLTPETMLLHNTHRRTQPWKTGLAADFTVRGTTRRSRRSRWLHALKSKLTGGSTSGYYRRHPDPAQESLFFGLLAECLEREIISPQFLNEEIANRHIREDAWALVKANARSVQAQQAR